jgi:preprotein translocase subunit YajC
MDATAIAQIANPFIQTVFIVVMGLGYFFTIRNLRSQVQEMNQARTPPGAGP